MEQLLLQIPVLGISIENFVYFALAALAGGAFGAYLGALPAFVFTGFLVFVGETLAYLQSEITGVLQTVDPGVISVGVTGALGFGAMFGPHVSFAGGVAASAYMGKKHPELEPSGWDLHPGKVLTEAYGTNKTDIIAVGALFGFIGWLIVAVLAGLGVPADNVAISVFLSAFIARLAFGYPLIGKPAGDSYFDVSPFERGDESVVENGDGEPVADGGIMRLDTGVWLGHQYKWGPVALLGVFGGAIGAYLWVFTGTFFLGYGISALSLLFLTLGVAKIPVTHHITLLGSVGGAVGAEIASGQIAATAGTEVAIAALIGGAVLGLISALLGEITERLFYAHSGTHVDPPAMAIALTMGIVYVLYALNVTTASGYLGL
jgi:hypothetical protein